jgi:hypothetical protein
MRDWLPASRTGQLTMCLNWTVILTVDVRTAWGVPQARYNELLALYDAAKALYQNPPSVADFVIGVFAKQKRRLSGTAGHPETSGFHAA